MRSSLLICAIMLFFSIFFSSLSTVNAGGLRLAEGVTLFYTGARGGTSGQGSYGVWNNSITILRMNQTSLVFLSNSTYEGSSTTSTVTLEYGEGIPTYVDYLTALIYLPPECVKKSQQQDLNWTTRINTRTLADVAEKTSQTLSYTVAAGTFQCLNITLALTGMDFGTLTLIYDSSSGILIFEEWVPTYGDIIILSLNSTTITFDGGQTFLNLVMPLTVLAIPASIGVHQVSKRSGRWAHRGKQRVEDGRVKASYIRVLYSLLAGATFGLASLLMPWGQLLGLQMFLPLSLPLVFAESMTSSTLISVTTSVAAHLAAVLAWLSLATCIYTNKRLIPQLIAVASGALALSSATLFFQTGWTLSWGWGTVIIAGIFAIVGGALLQAQRTSFKDKQSESDS